ncbi:MAG: hypothetical protein V1775_05275 [Bacteroidota bacterium]
MTACNEFSHTDSVIIYLDKAISISENIGYQKGISDCALQKGNEFYRQKNYSTALAQYEVVIKIAEKQNDTLLKAQCLAQMASIALDMGDDYKAIRQYYEALSLFELTGNKSGTAEVCNVIGGNKIYMREFDSANSYLQKAIKLNREIGNQAGIIHNNANLAFMYHYNNENDKARAIYADLIPALTEMGDSINLAAVYSHFSLFFQWLSKPDSSLFYLRKSLVISEKLNDKANLPTFYGMLGMIFIDKKEYDSAITYLGKSTILAREAHDFLTVRQALLLQISIDTITGNYAGAAGKLKEILAMNDSVYSQRIRNNLEASELKYENQRKNSLIDVQSVRLSTVTKQKQLLYLLFSTSLLISLLLILLILMFRRNNRKKQELLSEKLRTNELLLENSRKTDEINRLRADNAEKELKISEKEHLSNALALEQKNELLGMINDLISNNAMNADSIKESDLHVIRSSIRMQMRENEDKNLFNQKFNALHPDFFSGLKEKHPELTRSEHRFCAYLRLDLDSKQISNILNVTQEAIRKTRYRIRKKLNLDKDDSLEDYISTF